ncbi:MAG: hypothetical protein WBA12_00810 [Catalinimonas sp.]
MSDARDLAAHKAYDRIFRENIEAVIVPLLSTLLNLDVRSLEEMPDGLPTTLERQPDFLKRATDASGRAFVLHLEFQTRDDPDMVLRMLEYKALLLRKYRLTAFQYVLYLWHTPTRMATKYTDEDLQFRYTLIDIRDLDAEAWVAREEPEAVVLSLLGHWTDTPDVYITRILRRLSELASRDDRVRLNKYLEQLKRLARLRGLESEIYQSIEAMPIELDIETDGIYKLGEARGEARGEAHGEARGEAKIIRRFLASGEFTPEQIAQVTGLPLERILKIQARTDDGEA